MSDFAPASIPDLVPNSSSPSSQRDVPAESGPRSARDTEVSERPDLYAAVHKGLRAFGCEVLVALGRTDPDDERAWRQAHASVVELLDLFAIHLHDEEQFMHPALEARRAGSARARSEDHRHHVAAIQSLRVQLAAVDEAVGLARARAVETLYMGLTLFVADNLVHMYAEQTQELSVLWECYSDQELTQIEQALVASIPPGAMAVFLRWMLRAARPRDRANMLAELEASAPIEVVALARGFAKEGIDAKTWARVEAMMRRSE